MKCWICSRSARGFGHSDTRYALTDPRHYPIDWVFCSRRCLEAFHVLYGRWRAVLAGDVDRKEVPMIDPSEIEQAAMRRCLRAFGEAGAAIGFGKPLGQYTETEALQVIDAIVTRYTEAMVEHHEATKYPPVRGMVPTPDPLANASSDARGEATTR
ncbi:DUF6511 domain-containing protein [Aquabacterium sp. A7-Y]|uniref:DUF6511 domain-containing protein n=1 Tax=Aquabacterium sp. A7-Y TaxID=1349605 RepID=UPI00223DC891|nr:DUF6511 domain-containing protein [Aquabacterium sp. A7-Y]MCW7536248.1 DUF6511 domain-containing protein [Aquabacterium sp. A7-Y]